MFYKEYSELYTSTKSTDLLLLVCLVSVRGTGLLLLFSLFHELHRRTIVLKLLLNFSAANWGISDSGIKNLSGTVCHIACYLHPHVCLCEYFMFFLLCQAEAKFQLELGESAS